MKVEELKDKNLEALNTELEALRKEQFNLRMQQSTGQLAQTHLAREVRRNIARVKTVINQKQAEAAS